MFLAGLIAVGPTLNCPNQNEWLVIPANTDYEISSCLWWGASAVDKAGAIFVDIDSTVSNDVSVTILDTTFGFCSARREVGAIHIKAKEIKLQRCCAGECSASRTGQFARFLRNMNNRANELLCSGLFKVFVTAPFPLKLSEQVAP
jgi:hypothetical protein